MDCPQCGATVDEAALVCPGCGLEFELVDEDPDDAFGIPPVRDHVTVLLVRDPTLLPVVRSLLEAEGIPCVIENEIAQDFIGLGRVPLGWNLPLGPVRVDVPHVQAEAARELLAARVSAEALERAAREADRADPRARARDQWSSTMRRLRLSPPPLTITK